MVFPNPRVTQSSNAVVRPFQSFPFTTQECPSLIVEFDADEVDGDVSNCQPAEPISSNVLRQASPALVQQSQHSQQTVPGVDGKVGKLTEVEKLRQALEAKQKEIAGLRALTKAKAFQNTAVQGLAQSAHSKANGDATQQMLGGNLRKKFGQQVAAAAKLPSERTLALKKTKLVNTKPTAANQTVGGVQSRVSKPGAATTRVVKLVKAVTPRKAAVTPKLTDNANPVASQGAGVPVKAVPQQLAEEFLSSIVLPAKDRAAASNKALPQVTAQKKRVSSVPALIPAAAAGRAEPCETVDAPLEVSPGNSSLCLAQTQGNAELAVVQPVPHGSTVSSDSKPSESDPKILALIAQKNLLEAVARGVFRELRDKYDEIRRQNQLQTLRSSMPSTTTAQPATVRAFAGNAATSLVDRRRQLADCYAERKRKAEDRLRELCRVADRPVQPDNSPGSQGVKTHVRNVENTPPVEVVANTVVTASAVKVGGAKPGTQIAERDTMSRKTSVVSGDPALHASALPSVVHQEDVRHALVPLASDSPPQAQETKKMQAGPCERACNANLSSSIPSHKVTCWSTGILCGRYQKFLTLALNSQSAQMQPQSTPSDQPSAHPVAVGSKRMMNACSASEPPSKKLKPGVPAVSPLLRPPLLFGSLAAHVANQAGDLSDWIVCTKDDTNATSEDVPAASRQYASPLERFTAYRVVEVFKHTPHVVVTSPTLALGLHPHWPVCPFECRGACKNMQCIYQMVADYSLNEQTAAEILKRIYCQGSLLNLPSSSLPQAIRRLLAPAGDKAGATFVDRNSRLKKKRVTESKQAAMSNGGKIPMYTVWGGQTRLRSFESIMLAPANDGGMSQGETASKEHTHSRAMDRYHRERVTANHTQNGSLATDQSAVDTPSLAHMAPSAQPARDDPAGASHDAKLDSGIRSLLREHPYDYNLWLSLSKTQPTWQEAALVLQQSVITVSKTTAPPSRATAQLVLDLALRLFSLWSNVGATDELQSYIDQLLSTATGADVAGSAAGSARSLLFAVDGHVVESAVLWLSCLHLLVNNCLPDAVHCRLGYPQECFAVLVAQPPSEVCRRVLDAASRAVGLSGKDVDVGNLSAAQLAVYASLQSAHGQLSLGQCAPSRPGLHVLSAHDAGMLAAVLGDHGHHSTARDVLSAPSSVAPVTNTSSARVSSKNASFLRVSGSAVHVDLQTILQSTDVKDVCNDGAEHASSQVYDVVNAAALHMLQGQASDAASLLDHALACSAASAAETVQYVLTEYIALMHATLSYWAQTVPPPPQGSPSISQLEQQVQVSRKQAATFRRALELLHMLITETCSSSLLQPLHSIAAQEPHRLAVPDKVVHCPTVDAAGILLAADLLVDVVPKRQQVQVVELVANTRPATPAVAAWLAGWGVHGARDAQTLAWFMPLVAAHCANAEPTPLPSVWLQAIKLCESHYPAAAAELCSKAAAAHPFVVALQKKRQQLQSAQGAST